MILMFKPGHVPWNKGLTGRNQKVAQNIKPMLDAAHEANRGKSYSPERRAKIAASRRRYLAQNREVAIASAKKARQILQEKRREKVICENCGREFKARISDKARFCSRHCASQLRQKRLWQNPEYVAKMMRSRGVKPNRTEKELEAFLEKHFPNEWKYVGDGEFILGGLCPDFMNINGKKRLIELFGAYWHDLFDIARRTEHFRQYGYHTIIVWENELKDKAKLLKKLKKESKKGYG